MLQEFRLENIGLVNRDKCEIFGFNSRLDTIQAVVANYKMKNKLKNITRKRIKNAHLFDSLLRFNSNVKLVKRLPYLKEIFLSLLIKPILFNRKFCCIIKYLRSVLMF